MNYPSVLIEEAVNELSKFPGVGKKSAMRMVLHLLKQQEQDVIKLGEAVIKLRTQIKYCKRCGNVSDADICNICNNPKRNQNNICLVVNGVGPDDLNIASLVERIKTEEITEIIMALSATMEGDTTVFYLSKKLKDLPVNISTISRGIAIGGELEYADEITLGRSIALRVPYAGN